MGNSSELAYMMTPKAKPKPRDRVLFQKAKPKKLKS
jgi:hypothetical protein